MEDRNKLFLLEHHLKQLLQGSGISQEVIESRMYRSIVEPSELSQLGFSRRQWIVPGLLLPVHCTDGSNSLFVYKPDVPRVYENKKKRNPDGSFKQEVIKYEMPTGAEIRLDCPPICRSRLADPDIELWITEGQKKADALASRGLCAIALLGVWNFKGKNIFGGITFLADWDYIALKGRVVTIVFDSDVMLKIEVKKALERLTEHLQRKGAAVSAIYLPHSKTKKIGVDDYLLEHTVEDLESLRESPRPQIKAAAPTVELLEDAPLTMRRPIALINKRAYVAVWPFVRVVKREDVDSSGNVVKLSEPLQVEEQRCLIVRDDGMTFGDDGFEPFEKLGILVQLPEIPRTIKLWSTRSIKAFRAGERPDPLEVFNKIADIVDRFIDFDRCFADQRTMAEMVSCYVISTWFLDAFNVVGYLWSNGEKGSGKTQLLLLIAELAHLGQVVLSGSTMAGLRDLADYGATLAFDDAETIADPRNTADGEKRTLLLAGNRRGNQMVSKEDAGGGKWRTRYVDTFCPRLFSAIRIPDDTLQSRTIIIPLIRTANRDKANSDVLDFSIWPHDRSALIDHLWTLALCHLPELKAFDAFVSEKAFLSGRDLEPWRGILAIAAWLESKGGKKLFEKMDAVSKAYKGEREEIDSDNLTILVLKAVQSLMEEKSDVLTFSDVSPEDTPVHLQTKYITEAAKQIAEDEEMGIDPERINSRSIGWILKRLRFEHKRTANKGSRGWIVTRLQLQKFFIAFGLLPPGKTSLNVKTSEAQAEATTLTPDSNIERISL